MRMLSIAGICTSYDFTPPGLPTFLNARLVIIVVPSIVGGPLSLELVLSVRLSMVLLSSVDGRFRDGW